jgi:hypothetical protein
LLAYNELAYKKTKDDYKLDNRIHKKDNSQSDICKIADEKTAFNEGGKTVTSNTGTSKIENGDIENGNIENW